jgi:hypothetical protein
VYLSSLDSGSNGRRVGWKCFGVMMTVSVGRESGDDPKNPMEQETSEPQTQLGQRHLIGHNSRHPIDDPHTTSTHPTAPGSPPRHDCHLETQPLPHPNQPLPLNANHLGGPQAAIPVEYKTDYPRFCRGAFWHPTPHSKPQTRRRNKNLMNWYVTISISSSL